MTPENLRGLVIPRMDEPRGTLSRPNTSVFFQPITRVLSTLGEYVTLDGVDEYLTLEGLAEYLTLEGLGSWLSKKVFGARGDNMQAFFSERNAVKVGMLIGGPAGAALAADAKEKARRSREEQIEFQAPPASKVDPAKVAAGLKITKPAPPEKIAKDLILDAVRAGAWKQGMGAEAYLADRNFSAKAVRDALEALREGRKELKLQLDDNKKEQEILANEIAQVLTQGRVPPKKDAMPLEKIQELEAKATIEVMKHEQILIVPENVVKVIPEIHAEWSRHSIASLDAAKAEERLLRETLKSVDKAEKTMRGVTIGARMGKEWGRGGSW